VSRGLRAASREDYRPGPGRGSKEGRGSSKSKHSAPRCACARKEPQDFWTGCPRPRQQKKKNPDGSRSGCAGPRAGALVSCSCLLLDPCLGLHAAPWQSVHAGANRPDKWCLLPELSPIERSLKKHQSQTPPPGVFYHPCWTPFQTPPASPTLRYEAIVRRVSGRERQVNF